MAEEDWLATLRRFRREHHLTQRELAVFLGVNQKTVSRWERGIDHPSAETRDRLRSLLHGGPQDRLPEVYEAVREAPIPIALVDNNGNVLVASRLYGSADAQPAKQSAEIGQLPTVLVIEDDASVLKATRVVLKRWHFLTVGASDGEAAVRMVNEAGVRPNVAIIDFVLPGRLDGVDTAKALRQRLPDLPVLIVSGEANAERMGKISDSGLPFIGKPIDPDKIRTVLLAMMPQNSSSE
ncbi:MAG TPA: response regulator [Magnetospirillum sp.]|nr:response regulator [Magnetospirillum sp.]